MGRIAAIAALVIAALVGGAVAFGAIPADDGKIYACYSNGDGSVRVQSDPAKPCPKGWTPLNWTANPPAPPTLKTYENTKQITLAPDQTTSVKIACDEGDFATGGGWQHNGVDVFINGGTPTNHPTEWLLGVQNESSTSERVLLGLVTCIDNAPAHE